jgi:hypothetical protein
MIPLVSFLSISAECIAGLVQIHDQELYNLKLVVCAHFCCVVWTVDLHRLCTEDSSNR